MPSFDRKIVFLHSDTRVREEVCHKVALLPDLENRLDATSDIATVLALLRQHTNLVIVYPSSLAPDSDPNFMSEQLVRPVAEAYKGALLLNYDTAVNLNDGGHGHIDANQVSLYALLEILEQIHWETTIEGIKQEVSLVK